MKLLLRILILMICAGSVIALACLDKRVSLPEKQSSDAPVRNVRAAHVRMVKMSREVRLSGVTRAVKRAGLSFTIGERLIKRPVKVGDHVEAGQILARLDDRKLWNNLAEATAAVRELEARIGQIRRDRDRYTGLVSVNASARAKLEKILETEQILLATRSAAEARVREAERMAEEAVMKAPFAGTVTEVLLEPGEFAVPGKPVLVLSGDGPVEVEIEVPESLILSLKQGDTVTVNFPLAGLSPVSGTIAFLGKAATGPGRLFPVLISINPDAPATAGMTAEIVFKTEGETYPCVPLSAVVDPGGSRPVVFTITNGVVKETEVDVVGVDGDCVALKGLLNSEDTVVAGGHASLLPGDRLNPVFDEPL